MTTDEAVKKVDTDKLLDKIREVVRKDGALTGSEIIQFRDLFMELDEKLSKGARFPKKWITQDNRLVDAWFDDTPRNPSRYTNVPDGNWGTA